MNINWFPGHMAKTRKQITDDLKLVDVVIEILDARIPISSQNPEIKQITQNKKKVIILNKCDLSDEKQNNKWAEYFIKKGQKVVLVDSNTGKGINEVIKQTQTVMEDELKKLVEKGRIGRRIRVMIVGIPNVGKSSFINRITKKTTAEVGNKPGVTKKRQWLKVGQDIEIMDTPGLLSKSLKEDGSGEKLAIAGNIKEEVLDEETLSYSLINILMSNDWYEAMFKDRYGLDSDIDSMVEFEILAEVGRKRGALLKGDNVDTNKAAKILLDDYRSGRIGKISLE